MKRKILLLGVLSIIMCLTLTGCGKKEESKNEEKITSKDNGIVNTINNDDTDDNNVTDDTTTSITDDIKLYSDDTKIVYEMGEGKMVFYYSGNEITGCKLYIEYPDAATAKAAIDLSELNEDDTVKNVYAEGKYLVVEYKESEYADLTVEELKTLNTYFTEVTK